MSTFVCRYAPPEFPALVSWYARPSPLTSKFSASMVPGSGTAVPVNADDDTTAGLATIVESFVGPPGTFVEAESTI